MKKFLSVHDIDNLKQAILEAKAVKKTPFAWDTLGKNKTIALIFFNPSLRTRLSTQKAAMNLGMNVMIMNIGQEGWKLETEQGVIMDGDKPEHIREAIPVIGSYCDIIGIRTFAGLTDPIFDYEERIIQQFVQLAGIPVVSLEAATRHPLQSFADILTIEEYKKTERPKVVLTWAPHPRALPQAVANSFAEWALAMGYDLTITHPKGYELSPNFTQGATMETHQQKALEGADFVYAKNWATFNPYGKILSTDRAWTVDKPKMELTNNAYFMHCLPVRRNMIVSDDVIEGPQSIVLPQAANREVAAQTILKKIVESMP